MEAIKEAGFIMQTYFQGQFVIESKEGINNLVTEVDRLSEDKIISIIKKHCPDHSIIS